MPLVAYSATVGVSGESASLGQEAVAEASRFLAAADTTTIMEFARIKDTHVSPIRSDNYKWEVVLTFTAPVGLQSNKERFEEELDILAHVTDWQEVEVPDN